MTLARSRIHWDDLASLDPCWAILSRPEKRYGKWKLDEFFATGESEIAALLDNARQTGVAFGSARVLDFGCGIGRLTRALAARFDQVTGVDISHSMIAQAVTLVRRNNCAFVLNSYDALPFSSNAFDLVLSAIVLQHVPEQHAVRNYIAEFARVLKPSGMLVVQLPSHIPPRRRLQMRPRLYSWLRAAGFPENLLYRRLCLHPIPMNFLPEIEVKKILEVNRCQVVKIVSDDRAGPHIESRTYFATKN